MGAVKDSGEGSISVLHEMIYENGVERRPIAFGDPFHIANLCVTWASIFAFGDTEKADHSQVHHRQLLQSIHSLHSADVAFSQSKMDDVMKGFYQNQAMVFHPCQKSTTLVEEIRTRRI